MRTPIDDMRDLISHAGEENPHEIRARLVERLKNKLKIKEKDYVRKVQNVQAVHA